MLGAMGFSCQLINWSTPVRDVAREEIAWYKEHIRPVLGTGRLYHLLPQPTIPSRDLPTPDVWEAYQLSSADDETHVVLAFRNVSPDANITLPLRLSAESDYVVHIEGQEQARLSGHDLVVNGLTVACPLLASAWIILRRERENPA